MSRRTVVRKRKSQTEEQNYKGDNMSKKFNGMAKWIVVGIALLTVAFNSGILYRDVQHLRAEVKDIKIDVRALHSYLLHEEIVAELPK